MDDIIWSTNRAHAFNSYPFSYVDVPNKINQSFNSKNVMVTEMYYL